MTVTELRRRMMEDLALAGYSPKTQKSYIDAVRGLAKHYMRPPDRLSEDEVRQFFLHLINKRKAARSTVTIYLCGIKFFFEKTLGRAWPVFKLVRPRRSRKLPVVLSREEVRSLLRLLQHPIVRMALTVMYACGLRISEVVRLTTKDIDADRHQLWVRCGKGGKDRAVPLPDHVLSLLRTYYKKHGNSGTWLFPQKQGHIGTDVLQDAFKMALREASINKNATPPQPSPRIRHAPPGKWRGHHHSPESPRTRRHIHHQDLPPSYQQDNRATGSEPERPHVRPVK